MKREIAEEIIDAWNNGSGVKLEIFKKEDSDSNDELFLGVKIKNKNGKDILVMFA